MLYQQMKVLQVIDRLNVGGAEKIFLNLLTLLNNAENVQADALIFQRGFPLDDKIDNRATIFFLDRSNKYSFKKLYEANKICSGYDIVHVHMRHCYAYIRAAQLLFGGKYKLILHDHYGNIEIDQSVPSKLNSLMKPKYYIGVSDTLCAWAISRLRMNERNVLLLANTILPDAQFVFSPLASSLNAFMVSNIRPDKNIEFAIKLCEKIDCELTVYGNIHDKEYFDYLQSMSGGNVHFVQGVTDLTQYYNKHNFAIHCARSETGPLVLLECLAYGIPFLAYDTGQVAASLKNYLPAYFMSDFNVESWVEQIKSAFNSSDKSEELRQLFDQLFSPKAYLKQCLSIYQKIHC